MPWLQSVIFTPWDPEDVVRLRSGGSRRYGLTLVGCSHPSVLFIHLKVESAQVSYQRWDHVTEKTSAPAQRQPGGEAWATWAPGGRASGEEEGGQGERRESGVKKRLQSHEVNTRYTLQNIVRPISGTLPVLTPDQFPPRLSARDLGKQLY